MIFSGRNCPELVLFTYTYCVAELGSEVVSIGWETGAVCPTKGKGPKLERARPGPRARRPPVNISILCVKFISKIPFNEFAFLAGYS